MKTAVLCADSTEKKYIEAVLSTTNDTGMYYSRETEFLKEPSAEKYDAVIICGRDPAVLKDAVHRMCPYSSLILIGDGTEDIGSACGAGVVGYVRKENLPQELPYVWRRLRQEENMKTSATLIQHNGRLLKVKVDSVLYAEIVARRIYVHMYDGKIYALKPQTLQELYEKFRRYGFVYISRSCFVNAGKIRMIASEKLYLSGMDEPLYFSKKRRRQLCREIESSLVCG